MTAKQENAYSLKDKINIFQSVVRYIIKVEAV